MLRAIFLVLALALTPHPSPAAEAAAPRSIFLVASRDLQDPNFRQTVVLVTQAAATPMGVIINRASRVPVARLFPDIAGLDAKADRVFIGGPVARQTLLFLFRARTPPKDSVEVMEGVWLSTSASVLRELLKRDNPLQGLRIFAGYSGWSPGQLETEIAGGGWHLAPADADTLFDKAPETVWPELIQRTRRKMVDAPRAASASDAVSLR